MISPFLTVIPLGSAGQVTVLRRRNNHRNNHNNNHNNNHR